MGRLGPGQALPSLERRVTLSMKSPTQPATMRVVRLPSLEEACRGQSCWPHSSLSEPLPKHFPLSPWQVLTRVLSPPRQELEQPLQAPQPAHFL